MTLIKPDRKPANLGEAGGTHGEDFSPPVWEGSEPHPRRRPVDPADPSPLQGRFWDRAAVSQFGGNEAPDLGSAKDWGRPASEG